MPYIKIHGLNDEQVATTAQNIVGDLSKISGAPESKFHFLQCGNVVGGGESFAYVEVTWYARTGEQMQGAAKVLYDEIRKHGNYTVNVVFHDLPPAGTHYTNGEDYKKPQK